jgi:hypothetical protein
MSPLEKLHEFRFDEYMKRCKNFMIIGNPHNNQRENIAKQIIDAKGIHSGMTIKTEEDIDNLIDNQLKKVQEYHKRQRECVEKMTNETFHIEAYCLYTDKQALEHDHETVDGVVNQGNNEESSMTNTCDYLNIVRGSSTRLLLHNSLFLRIVTIFLLQDVNNKLPIDFSVCMDCIIICCNDVTDSRALYDTYGLMFEEFEQFDKCLKEFTKEGKCMVLYLNCTKPMISDSVFWYNM